MIMFQRFWTDEHQIVSRFRFSLHFANIRANFHIIVLSVSHSMELEAPGHA